MTPKIFKAGLLVGALVFALVSCGQNTKPMEELPETVSLNSGGEWTRKITAVIKDKDSDSLTLSNFSSTDAVVATIGVDKATNPTEIIITAGTLLPAPPATRQKRATVSFQVSDGTETITVSVKVTVTAPLLKCMLEDAIIPIACPLGSVNMPEPLTRSRTEATIAVFKIPLHKFPEFQAYATVATAADDPNYAAPVVVGGARYLHPSLAPQLVDCDGTVDYDKNTTLDDDDECLEINLPVTLAQRIDTPVGVTVMIEITAANATGATDDVTDIIHFRVAYTGSTS